MAFGFTPKHVENFPLNDLTQQQFLILANESARKVGWQISYLSDNGLIGYTDNGMFSIDAEIKIKIEDGIATIRSASIGSELMDWGRNKKNITNFISTFEALKPTLTKEELNVKYLALTEQLVSPEDDLLKLNQGTTQE
jgi:rhomboid protease GluP